MDTTLVAPPAPRRKRRSGLGLYQDRRGRWVLDLVIKGRRFVRRYGAVPYQVARDLAKADATAYRVEVLTGVSATPKVTDLTVTAALRRFEVERFGTLKPSTRALYRRLMRPLTAHLGATRLSALCALIWNAISVTGPRPRPAAGGRARRSATASSSCCGRW